MKITYCPKCSKEQKTGGYCLVCGTRLVEKVTAEIQSKGIHALRTHQEYIADIKKWLARIGVASSNISSHGSTATVDYVLNGKKYSFSSSRQQNVKNNCAAIEQFLHYRVLGIERGIETSEQAFAGYQQLPAPGEETKGNATYFSGFKTQEAARAQYLDLCKKLHPDQNGGRSDEFKAMRVQYEQLPRSS